MVTVTAPAVVQTARPAHKTIVVPAARPATPAMPTGVPAAPKPAQPDISHAIRKMVIGNRTYYQGPDYKWYWAPATPLVNAPAPKSAPVHKVVVPSPAKH